MGGGQSAVTRNGDCLKLTYDGDLYSIVEFYFPYRRYHSVEDHLSTC